MVARIVALLVGPAAFEAAPDGDDLWLPAEALARSHAQAGSQEI
jgi:hypothetical protein